MNRSCSQSSNLNLGLNVSQGRGLGAGEAGVKIGGLWKRSQGVSRFTKPNYKHRVFILTEQALSYYQGTIDVSILVYQHQVVYSEVDITSSHTLHAITACCKLQRNDIMFFLISCITENRSVERQSVAGYSACCGVRGRRCFQPGPHIPGKYNFLLQLLFPVVCLVLLG